LYARRRTGRKVRCGRAEPASTSLDPVGTPTTNGVFVG
jgi:hypothetical protein